MKAIFFPGQGAQFRGKGKNLFPRYRELPAQASDILGYSIDTLCKEDPDGKLRLTQYTQPALHAVNALGYYQRRDENPDRPDFVAGHSLGEYNALLAAEVFDFATGLKLVQRRGELMGMAKDGGMAAVIGIDEDSLADLLRKNHLSSIDLANFNTLNQTVIAGPKEAIQQAEKLLATQNIRCVALNVSAAFHSRYMKDAQHAFAGFLEQFRLDAPKVPVIANVSARPYRAGEVADLLARQISGAVRWTDTVRYLMGKGCTEWTEAGVNVLTRMIDEVRKTATALVVQDEPAPEFAPPADATAVERGETPPEAATHLTPPMPSTATPSPLPTPIAEVAVVPCAPATFAGPHAPLSPETLGSALFRKRFGVRYAYVAGWATRRLRPESST
jgi:trans-AT polyketide synthase/acyltransferase/oxidoreductase domain-containing protein